MKNEYPHMLYLDGDTAAKYRVVADADAERAAGGEGYFRAGGKPSAQPVVDAKPRKVGRPRKDK